MRQTNKKRGPDQPFSAFDRAAAERYDAWYESGSGKKHALAEQAMLARLLPAASPAGRTLLEVGCGTGHFSRWFGGRGFDVVGLDLAAEMLAVAAERGGGPRYVRGSALALPFADRSFDLVAFVTSLEFVSDREAALREAARVARRGLLLGALNVLSPLGLRRKALALRGRSVYAGAYFPTPWGLAGLVRRALPGQVVGLRWQAAPRHPASVLARLPFGPFIAMRVDLRPDRD